MSNIFHVLALCTLFALSGCSLFGYTGVEQPAQYSVMKVQEEFEVRKYPEVLAVQTTVSENYDKAGNKAFKKLFDYISGKNSDEQKIAMTAPVFMTPEGQEASGWTMSFLLPLEYWPKDAPLPSDPDVRISREPEKMVAVKKYSGRWTTENIQDQSKLLREWAEAQDFTISSPARNVVYNPPWTLPFLRKNEIHIDVQ